MNRNLHSDSLGVAGRRILVTLVGVFMLLVLTMAALVQLRPELWFVRTFLAGGKWWVWAVGLLFAMAGFANWLDRWIRKRGKR